VFILHHHSLFAYFPINSHLHHAAEYIRQHDNPPFTDRILAAKQNILSFPIHNLRDIYYPINPAFQVLWTVVFNGNDIFVEISQFSAMLTCAISVYGISRVLDRSKKSALFNSLLFLSYPIVLMQGTTTQTDLVVAALISCAFYFLFMGSKKSNSNTFPYLP
jgi:hypothetical protein